MINIAFIKNGQIEHTVSPGDDSIYADGQIIDGFLCKHFEVGVNLSEFSRVNYWDGSEWITRVPKPNRYYDWETTSWALNSSRLQADIRSTRNDLLLRTDYTQLPDSPVDAALWVVYRQELRDLPANLPIDLDNSDNVVWPVPPS